jgi:vesicle coat complex subunit
VLLKLNVCSSELIFLHRKEYHLLLEKVNYQNKVTAYGKSIETREKLDGIKQILSKIYHENTLSSAFFEVNIKYVTTEIDKELQS